MALRKFTSRRIGETIKQIRLGLKLSQEEFGKEVGNYSQDTVAKWEAGQVPHALVLKWISELSDPFRSVDWILSRNSLKRQSIPNPAGTDDYGSNAREEVGHDLGIKRNTLLRQRRNVESARNERHRTARYPADKEAAARQNPFEILTDQLRLLVREEIQAALKGTTRPVDLSAIPILPEWLRAMGLSGQHKRHADGFKRRSARVK